MNFLSNSHAHLHIKMIDLRPSHVSITDKTCNKPSTHEAIDLQATSVFFLTKKILAKV